MSSNQPVQPTPTAAVRFLFHTLGALVAGVLVAIVVTLFNYTATDGQSVDIRTVLIAAGFSALGFLGAFIRTDVKPNQALLGQGLSDLLQATHQPLLTYLSQIFAMQQQVVQAVQSIPPAVLPAPPDPIVLTNPANQGTMPVPGVLMQPVPGQPVYMPPQATAQGPLSMPNLDATATARQPSFVPDFGATAGASAATSTVPWVAPGFSFNDTGVVPTIPKP